MDVATEEPEDQEERGEDRLECLLLEIGIAQPLPLEIQPPHPDLRSDRCLTLRRRRLPVLLAVEVVLEGFPGLLAERAIPVEFSAAARWFAFINGREIRRANGLGRERREAQHQRTGADEQQPPPKQCLRAPDEYRDRNRRSRDEASHVVG